MGSERADVQRPEGIAAEGDRLPDAATDALVRFARAGHDAGYPSADLEERVLTVAAAFGLGAQASATPTLVEVSVGSIPRQQSYALRVRPAEVDLDAIARLDDLVQEVSDGGLDAHGSLRALDELRDRPARRSRPILLVGYAVAPAALAPVVGGGSREAAAAAVVGLLVGAIAIATRRTSRTEPVVAPVAAIAASLSAALIAELGLESSPDVVTLAALVTFLPGMTLTIGMRELATQHLQSGVANTASALVQLLGLAFGVGVGQSIAASWFGDGSARVPSPALEGFEIVAPALVAGLAFTVILRARYRDAAVMCSATCLAVLANEIGTRIFGHEAAVFAAALAVGLVGGLVGSLLRRSALVFIVPGVLMLVPGSAGFSSVLRLLTGETVSGLTAGFDTFVAAMSIAYGLMVSSILLPPRRSRG